jgi:hypothetical protein
MSYLHTHELHISLISYRVRERRHTQDLPWVKNITYFERRDKAWPFKCLSEDPKIPHIERLVRVIFKELWVLFANIYENSRTEVEQIAWDIVLDLNCSIFQLLKTQVQVKATWLKETWVSLKVSAVYSSPKKEFLFECMCTFKAWKHCSNSWSILGLAICSRTSKR